MRNGISAYLAGSMVISRPGPEGMVRTYILRYANRSIVSHKTGPSDDTNIFTSFYSIRYREDLVGL